MENKYYIPTPQEICLDFELERYYKHTSNWVKGHVTLHTIFEDVDSVYGVNGMDWMVDGVDQNHPSCYTRVKILDEQDILDCGFKYINNDLDLLTCFQNFNLRVRFRLNYKDEFPSIRIYKKSKNLDTQGCIFIGVLKNKSEFTKVLNQVKEAL